MNIPEYVYACEKGRKCKWKAFHASYYSLTEGKIKNSTSEWREWHEKKCGGRLIQYKLVEVNDEPT